MGIAQARQGEGSEQRRRTALRQSERRSEPGLFLGRHRGGTAQRPVTPPRAARSSGAFRRRPFATRTRPAQPGGCTSATSSPAASVAAPGMVRISSQLLDGRDGLEQWSASYDRPEGQCPRDPDGDRRKRRLRAQRRTRPDRKSGTNDGRHEQSRSTSTSIFARSRRRKMTTAKPASSRQMPCSTRRSPRTRIREGSRRQVTQPVLSRRRRPVARGNPPRLCGGRRAAQRAVDFAPRLPEGYAALADALYGQRKISAAMRAIQTGANIGPNDLQLLQAAVTAFVAGGQTRRAIGYAERMVADRPAQPPVPPASLLCALLRPAI